MRRLIVLLVGILYCAPAFSQEVINRLFTQITPWDSTRIEKVLTEKINARFDYLNKRHVSLIDYAKENYDVTVVFQAKISCEDSLIDISIEDNDFPMDLYYVNDRNKVELIVLTYRGVVEIVDTDFSALMIGLAKKEKRAFRFIKKQSPDLIFVCDDVFGCFFYVKNNTVYVYDYYNHEKGPLQEYSRLSEQLEAGKKFAIPPSAPLSDKADQQ